MTKQKSRKAKSVHRRMQRIDSRFTVRHATRCRRLKPMTDTPHRDPTQEFANRIVAELENGVKPRGPAVGPR